MCLFLTILLSTIIMAVILSFHLRQLILLYLVLIITHSFITIVDAALIIIDFVSMIDGWVLIQVILANFSGYFGYWVDFVFIIQFNHDLDYDLFKS